MDHGNGSGGGHGPGGGQGGGNGHGPGGGQGGGNGHGPGGGMGNGPGGGMEHGPGGGMGHGPGGGQGGGGDHGDHGGGGTCPMNMSFHAGHCERILWNGWVASTVTQFVFSALAIFLIAFLYEALKFWQEYYRRQTIRKESERIALELTTKNSAQSPTISTVTASQGPAKTPATGEKTYVQRLLSVPHLIQTLVNMLQITISYLLMLIFMTFNYWLCLAVVLGLALGYFSFGWIKQNVYENECCP